MRRLLDFIHRHEPRGEVLSHFKTGLGAVIAMTLVGGLAAWTGLPLLLAPFGATAVLLFGHPESPLAQPANILGGYLLSAIISVALFGLLPVSWWLAVIAMGLVIVAMPLLRVTHPPAAAVPLVFLSTPMTGEALFLVVVAGAACLIAVAVIHHWLPPRMTYPRRAREPS